MQSLLYRLIAMHIFEVDKSRLRVK